MTSDSDADRLLALRRELDRVDAGLVELAAERQRIVSEIGRVKQGFGRQLRDFRREREVISLVRGRAETVGLDPDVAEDLLKRLIEASLTRQERERGRLSGRGDGRRALVIGGAGLMGRWLAEFMDNQGYEVLLADPCLDADGQARFHRWQDAPADVDVILIAAPISRTATLIEELSDVGTRALVVEIGSVKTPLLSALRRGADAGLRLCAMHPMFGPDTTLLSGRHVLLMDVGVPAAVDDAASLFSDTMAEVLRLPLEQHDRLIALVLGLSHLINIAFFAALAESGVPAEQLAGISSTTFKRQLDVARAVAAENPELYFEIQHLNGEGRLARESLRRVLDQINLAVEGGEIEAFRSLMLRGRRYLQTLQGPSGPEA